MEGMAEYGSALQQVFIVQAVVGLAVALVYGIFFAFVTHRVAGTKGYPGYWWVIGLLFGIFGLVAAGLMPKVEPRSPLDG
jgi:hypothetical protein